MKLGIVGTGLIVKDFLPILEKLQNIECQVLCGTSRSKAVVEELCLQYHIKYGVTEYKELLEADIDTVYVAVPNHLHYQFCKEALAANKNVIVEKPMTSNFREASELARMAMERNLFFFEAINNQYLGNYLKIRELLPQIGEIKLVQCNFSQYSSRYDAFCKGQLHPVFDPEKSGGALMDINIYNVYFVMGLFGIPEKVSYSANVERNIDTSGILLMEYPDFQAVCIGAKDCSAPARCVIQGTKGYILQDSTTNICEQISMNKNDGTKLIIDENASLHRMSSEFQAFADQIHSGSRTECYRMLNHSLSVSKVLFETRQAAGVHFLADDWEL